MIGAGRIGLQTLKAAHGRGITQVAVANRTKARAETLRVASNASAHDLGELEAALAQADVAISATSSDAPVVGVGDVHRAMARRADRPLVLVDLAVPADVEREVADVDGVRLFDVDDLRVGLDDAMTARLREVPRVEAVVEDEVEEFGRRYRELEVEPLLSELRRQAESSGSGRSNAPARSRRRRPGCRGTDGAPVADAREAAPPRSDGPSSRARGAGGADEVVDAVRDLFGISAPSDQ